MRIVSFGQVVDVDKGGAFSHQFTIEAAGGERFTVETDELTIQRLIEIYTGAARGNGQPKDPGEARYQQWRAQMESQSVHDQIPVGIGELPDEEPEGVEFGGDYDPGEVANSAASQIIEDTTESVMGAIAEVPAETPPASRGLGQSPPVPIRRQPPVDKDGFVMPVKARTVPKDEMGYPIVSKSRRAPSIPDDDGSEDGTQM